MSKGGSGTGVTNHLGAWQTELAAVRLWMVAQMSRHPSEMRCADQV